MREGGRLRAVGSFDRLQFGYGCTFMSPRANSFLDNLACLGRARRQHMATHSSRAPAHPCALHLNRENGADHQRDHEQEPQREHTRQRDDVGPDVPPDTRLLRLLDIPDQRCSRHPLREVHARPRLKSGDVARLTGEHSGEVVVRTQGWPR